MQDVYIPVERRRRAPRRSTRWWWPDADPDAPVVYYLHGVRWNLTGHVRRMEQLRRFGFSVFAIDYRGFGKSDGELPSEQMTYEDAAAGWAWLAKKVPDPRGGFIYGHSLGGAVAIDLAARLAAQAHGTAAGARPDRRVDVHLAARHRRRAVLELAADAPHHVAAIRFDREGPRGRRTRSCSCTAPATASCPPSSRRRCSTPRRGPKKLLLIENGGHNNAMWIGDGEYQGAFSDFFALLQAGRAADAKSVGCSRLAGRCGPPCGSRNLRVDARPRRDLVSAASRDDAPASVWRGRALRGA